MQGLEHAALAREGNSLGDTRFWTTLSLVVRIAIAAEGSGAVTPANSARNGAPSAIIEIELDPNARLEKSSFLAAVKEGRYWNNFDCSNIRLDNASISFDKVMPSLSPPMSSCRLPRLILSGSMFHPWNLWTV